MARGSPYSRYSTNFRIPLLARTTSDTYAVELQQDVCDGGCYDLSAMAAAVGTCRALTGQPGLAIWSIPPSIFNNSTMSIVHVTVSVLAYSMSTISTYTGSSS